MKLPKQIRKMEVYYDGRCGMCCTFHEWINLQPRTCDIDFIPYQAPRTEQLFPGISTLDPSREMIVRTDQNQIYRAAEAWVLCLYSCANQQVIARRLASPAMLKIAMLKIAIHTCRILAANRHAISSVFFRTKDAEVKKALHQMPVPKCESGYCENDIQK